MTHKPSPPQRIEHAPSEARQAKRVLRWRWWLVGGAAVLLLGWSLYGVAVRWRGRPPASDDWEAAQPSPGEAGKPSAALAASAPARSQGPVSDEALRREMAETAAALAERLGEKPDVLAALAEERRWQGKSAEACEYWKKCVAADPACHAAYCGLAEVADQKGDPAAAAEWARKALRVAPGSDEAARLLAHSLTTLGQFAEAREILEEHLRRNPRSAVSFFLLGQAHAQASEFDEAKRAFMRAIELAPDYTHAYFGLSVACARLGETDAAARYRQQFHTLKQRDQRQQRDDLRRAKDLAFMRRGAADVCATIGQVYANHGAMDLAEAVWQQGAAYDPQNRPCREALYRLAQRQGRHAEALRLAKELAAADPRNPEHQVAAAWQQFRLGQVDAAQAALREICQSAPNSAQAHAALARLLLQAGRDFPQAMAAARTAVELEPRADHYLLFGAACDANGDRAAALAALKRAAELEPDNPRFRQAYEALEKSR